MQSALDALTWFVIIMSAVSFMLWITGNLTKDFQDKVEAKYYEVKRRCQKLKPKNRKRTALSSSENLKIDLCMMMGLGMLIYYGWQTLTTKQYSVMGFVGGLCIFMVCLLWNRGDET